MDHFPLCEAFLICEYYQCFTALQSLRLMTVELLSQIRQASQPYHQ